MAPTEHTVKCTQEEDLRDWRRDALTASVFLEHQSRLLCLDPGTLPKSLGKQQRCSKYVGLCHPCGRCRWTSGPLVLAAAI